MSKGIVVPVVIDTNVLVPSVYRSTHLLSFLLSGNLLLVWNTAIYDEAPRKHSVPVGPTKPAFFFVCLLTPEIGVIPVHRLQLSNDVGMNVVPPVPPADRSEIPDWACAPGAPRSPAELGHLAAGQVGGAGH